jgi:hypothetical protein
VALLEFLLAAARARVVATDVLQRVARRFLVRVTAVRTVYVSVVVMIMVVIAIGTMDMRFLGHGKLLR